jgi:hypothetical protein
MIGESIPEAERQLVTFIPHAPKNMELAERLAWRAGYRVALRLLDGESRIYWCEKHTSTSTALRGQCDYARWKGYEGPPNECELVACSVVTGAREV